MKYDVHIFSMYREETARFLPQLRHRISQFLKLVNRSPQYKVMTSGLMARFAVEDPTIMMAFATDNEDNIVAHCIAEILEIDGVRVCFVGQWKSEVPGVLDKSLSVLDNWARSNNCALVRTESFSWQFSEKSATRLLRKYGYKIVAYSFERNIDDGRQIQQNKGDAAVRPLAGSS